MAALNPTAGSDCDFRIRWGGETPFDLTGWSVEVYDCHPMLLPYLTLTLGDPLLGEIIGRIEWNEAIKPGVPLHFRARISRLAQQQASHRIIARFT